MRRYVEIHHGHYEDDEFDPSIGLYHRRSALVVDAVSHFPPEYYDHPDGTRGLCASRVRLGDIRYPIRVSLEWQRVIRTMDMSRGFNSWDFRRWEALRRGGETRRDM